MKQQSMGVTELGHSIPNQPVFSLLLNGAYFAERLGICCFADKHAAETSNSKVWFVRNEIADKR
jgi:hypothetical protein